MKVYFKNTTIAFFFVLALVSCDTRNLKEDKKEVIFLADREAPLGWVYLRIFDDSTFEFEFKGLERKGLVYLGIVQFNADTILFEYGFSP